jgi:hypothetical protein
MTTACMPPLDERIALIEAVADAALTPPNLRALWDALPADGAPSVQMLTWGMRQALTQWRAHDLLNVMATEAPTSSLRAWVAPARAGWVLARTVPPAGLQAVMWGWLLGSHVITKPSVELVPFWRAWLDIVKRAAPALSSATQLCTFAQQDDDAARAFAARADVLSVYGGDDAVRAWRARHPRVIAHGHRVSAAYIDRRSLRDPARWPSMMDGIAWDMCAWDQQGCLSPISLLVEAPDPDDLRLLDAFLARLVTESLPEVERKLPAGVWSVAAVGARAAFIRAQRVLADTWDTPTASVLRYPLDADAPPRLSACLHRVLPVQPVHDEAEAIAHLNGLSPHLTCLGLASPDPDAPRRLAQRLARAGLNRVCPLGAMQAPPLGWRHDGVGVILPLVSAVDLETPSPPNDRFL